MALSKKTNTIIIGLFIVSLMVGSLLTLGSFGGSSSEDDRYDYNGHTYSRLQNGWTTYKENTQIFVRYGPRDLESYDVDITSINSFDIVDKIYFSTDPRDNIINALYDFNYNIKLPQRIVPACTVDIESCKNLPLKTCEDSDASTGIITFKNAENASVSFENNCLVVQGPPEDLIKVTDKLILKVKGLI